MPVHRRGLWGTPSEQYRRWLARIVGNPARQRRILLEAPWLDAVRPLRSVRLVRSGQARPIHERLAQHRAAQLYEQETERLLRLMRGEPQ